MNDDAPETSEEKRQPVEDLAVARGTPRWAFEAARAGERWAIGAERTLAEYDDAIHRAMTLRLG